MPLPPQFKGCRMAASAGKGASTVALWFANSDISPTLSNPSDSHAWWYNSLRRLAWYSNIEEVNVANTTCLWLCWGLESGSELRPKNEGKRNHMQIRFVGRPIVGYQTAPKLCTVKAKNKSPKYQNPVNAPLILYKTSPPKFSPNENFISPIHSNARNPRCRGQINPTSVQHFGQ